MPEIKPDIETFAKIKVVGVGGSGCSAINRMIASKIKGVEFLAINTDVQALHHSSAKKKIHIGQTTTRGLGAGMDPEVGLQAAQENIDDIREALKGADMVFITCGLGGGTGSGASSIIASVAREMGALVVAIVTKPFTFEGAQRTNIAENAHEQLIEQVDTIITIPNNKILQIIDKKTSLLDAFKVVDNVLMQGVQGISELITVPGLINVDFADVKSIMSNAGSTLMGIGEVGGDNRAVAAAKKAISSPLLDLSIDGAKGIMFIITGGSDLTMDEVNEAANTITENADSNARVIFGAVIDENMKDKVRITVVATGFSGSGKSSSGVISKSEVSKPVSSKPVKTSYSMNKLFAKKKIADQVDDSDIKLEPVPVKPEPIKAEDDDSVTEKIKSVPEPVSVSKAKPVPRPVSSDEEDLEIPAFIRKKMK